MADCTEKVFYQCQRCGNCCRWPGFVKVNENEVVKIAEYVGMELADFCENYTEILPDRQGLSLISKPNHECIFLEAGNVCKIQAVKPHQCKGFPNSWNFPGWREVCEAIPVPVPAIRKSAAGEIP